jgi:hypothetical protein
MKSISLLHSTGHREVDGILEGVVGLFELLFPGRVSGYYLTGSFSDGTAIPGSDIDMSVLFRGSFPIPATIPRSRRRVLRLRTARYPSRREQHQGSGHHRLRSLCERTLGFENHFLEMHGPYLPELRPEKTTDP